MLVFQDKFDPTLQAAAEIMAKLRPDLFTVEYALARLTIFMDDLKGHKSGDSIGTGGFELVRIEDDGMTGYSLMLNLVDFEFYPNNSFNGAIWQTKWTDTPLGWVVDETD